VRHIGSLRSQHGTIHVMMVGFIIVFIAARMMALDLSQIYNRKVELSSVADMAAMAAAKSLDGSSRGITNALNAASGVVTGLRYGYGGGSMTWSDQAITFSKAPDGSQPWVDAGTASGAPTGLLYVKVDTGGLDQSYGQVSLNFAPFFSPAAASSNVRQIAVAGRASLNITPLAVCAAESTAARAQTWTGYTELIQFGFRRGVNYDLMGLTPTLLDPVGAPGKAPSSSDFSMSIVGPHVCTGTIVAPSLTGSTIGIQQPFPLASLVSQLNSRFDQYDGSCNPVAAPPDSNIKSYPYSNVTWMSSDTSVHGPLWAYARAVPWSSYVAGQPEPTNGYTPFSATSSILQALYSYNPVFKATYPSGTNTPYGTSSFSQAPSIAHRPGLKNRRVLNVALLQCPVSGSSATVLGIGKFFMTEPATSTAVLAEFAGAVTDDLAGGTVELYR
jgi:hypothetical protein